MAKIKKPCKPCGSKKLQELSIIIDTLIERKRG